ncbi:prolipoprotein diacylglyceryl transferase [Gorillibacterium timonense]|uniref:prolipoprotein diacylglyceryl transferase n=1 Tax=Gorillibacterium timonense TaxID=1689269 RepID=UPI00071CD0C6|nr:prolipoprotein diacylglyceryl transferase [Gorillibacterium timonense]
MVLALDRIAFSIGSLSVTWYGIILASAALAGLYLAILEGKRFGIIPDFFMDVLLIGVPSAIVGARLYFVAFKWEDYRDTPMDIFKIWEGGIAIYGALIGAFIGAFFYIRAKGYSFWRIADICAPSLLLGQMIGRWGNYVNQEAYGGPVSESFLRDTLHLPSFIVDQMLVGTTYHHPTFLYESVWNFVGLLLLFWLRRRPFLRSGELLFSYLMWYSIGRFFIEGLRTDSLAFAGPGWLEKLMNGLWSPMTLLFESGAMEPGKNIRISQVIAVLLVIAAVIIITYRRKKGHSSERYLDPIVSTRVVAAGAGPGESHAAVAEPISVPVEAHAVKSDGVNSEDAATTTPEGIPGHAAEESSEDFPEDSPIDGDTEGTDKGRN